MNEVRFTLEGMSPQSIRVKLGNSSVGSIQRTNTGVLEFWFFDTKPNWTVEDLTRITVLLTELNQYPYRQLNLEKM